MKMTTITAVLAAIILSACGGGGDDPEDLPQGGPIPRNLTPIKPVPSEDGITGIQGAR